jgi:hypothetical protein
MTSAHVDLWRLFLGSQLILDFLAEEARCVFVYCYALHHDELGREPYCRLKGYGSRISSDEKLDNNGINAIYAINNIYGICGNQQVT